MKMTKIEKRFVNRRKKADRNIKKVEHAFQQIDIKNTNTVLELGCGVGFVATYLATSYNFVVYGTDYDVDQILIAKKLQPKMENLHFQVEDAAKLSFEDSSIDLILSQNVFHHIPNWEDAIHETARVLRSSGYVIWLDLIFPKVVKSIFRAFIKNYGLYTINDIKKTFKDSGFRTLFQEQSAHIPMRQHHFILQLHNI